MEEHLAIIVASVALFVNLVSLGVFIGWVKTKIVDHTTAIGSIEADLKGRMNRETMQLRFDEVNASLAEVKKTLAELRDEVKDAGCEYPKCVLGQVFTAHGATPVEIVAALAAMKKEKP